jgi:hypothetical protein
MRNEALGQFEAAAVMGVIFTRPLVMVRSGLLTRHTLHSHDGRVFSVYERRQCEESWQQYLLTRRGRPRQHQARRLEMLRLLNDEARPRIGVHDAICTYQAAEILGCWHTYVPRLAVQGKIVGRRLISRRGNASRLWIFSRESCLAYAKHWALMESTGKKSGRPRTGASDGKAGQWSFICFPRNENMQNQDFDHDFSEQQPELLTARERNEEQHLDEPKPRTDGNIDPHRCWVWPLMI